jgi:hypothetical protein
MARTARIAGLVVVAVLAAGCLGHGWGHPGGANGVRVVAPGDRTQVPAAGGAIPLRIELSRTVDPTTLRVRVVGDGLDRVIAPARLTIIGRTATATLTTAELAPGILTVEARAQRRGHGPFRPWMLGRSTISWEPAVDTARAARCDFLDTAKCLLPFPNDQYTVADSSTDTGRRVHFAGASMPANSSGVGVDPTEWNRNDGFSPGSPILAKVPGLDLVQGGAAPITDIGRSLRVDQPIVVIDAQTGESQPFYAELDVQADPAQGPMLIVRPARNLAEGHRFIVALRSLEDTTGATIPAGRAFQLYRDRIATFDPVIESRRAHHEQLFASLASAGVGRRDLFLAWDFTVASERNLSERMLHIRDDAFASLGGVAAAPAFTISSVENNLDDQIFRRVTGTFTVPNYLTGTGAPGSRFNNGPDGLPARNGDLQAGFICNIPRAASNNGAAPVTPARGGVYGHGLLGSNDEVSSGNVRAMANEHNFVFCATKWIGFSEDDVGVAVTALQDFSNFPKVADRTQQGFLDFLYLARLLHTPNGFVSDPAFQATDGTPLVDTSNVFYDGNSQGGILGGAVTAVSTEWTRAVLGVPGMNYSTLLQRSVDFDTYKLILEPAYPDELDRLLIGGIVQMLWDRSEANGYAAHMTDDPYPGTPAHDVLMHVAFGDHQVANVTAEVEARTIGARLRTPGLGPGRDPSVEPFWGIEPITGYPYDGSAIVVWDSGTPAPPSGNLPPRPPTYGNDPHGDPRNTPAARRQKSEFLTENGTVVDVCGGDPCLTAAHL